MAQFRVSGSNQNAFDNVAAEHLGINRTDLDCLDIISRTGPVTAGEIARQTGLSTGAVTAVIDRLERAGYARRVRDPEDRRRVLVEATPEFFAAAGPIWGPMAEEWQAMIERYSTEQLRLLLEFMSAGTELEARHIERIRALRDSKDDSKDN